MSSSNNTAVRLAQGRRIDPGRVIGWAVDADPDNDPTYPMRVRTKGKDKQWERPRLQTSTAEILSSIEHNRRPAVISNAIPPQGISGVIRRKAFEYSESDWRHWLLLLAADRTDSVEGIVDDLSNGQIPNFAAEIGLPAAWKHNKVGVLKGVAIATILATAAFKILHRRR
jgi:hypothetical protein